MEWLTDKEKRLLFSALTCEKKVCEEIDKGSCREAYEESLVSVIESLERKFYYDKLFKQIRTDAIDEFAELIESTLLNAKFGITDVRPMAEQLKGNNNGE